MVLTTFAENYVDQLQYYITHGIQYDNICNHAAEKRKKTNAVTMRVQTHDKGQVIPILYDMLKTTMKCKHIYTFITCERN